MGGVVTGQVRIRLGIAKVVECDDVEFIAATVLMNCTHDVATDTAVAVNAYLYCHVVFLQ